MTGLTIFDKIWAKHRILESDSGESLLAVDLHFLNETSFICFQELERLGRTIRSPKQSFLAMDHTVPTHHREAGIPDAENREAIEYLDRFARVTHAAAGVETRREEETDVIAVERLTRQASGFD